MNADHKRAISAGVSRFMQGQAVARRCPVCGRKAALGRKIYDQDWCLSQTDCRYCKARIIDDWLDGVSNMTRTITLPDGSKTRLRWADGDWRQTAF